MLPRSDGWPFIRGSWTLRSGEGHPTFITSCAMLLPLRHTALTATTPAAVPGKHMEQRQHSSDDHVGKEQEPPYRDEDEYFGGDDPLDAETADGRLALAPLATAANGRSPYSWQCPGEPEVPKRCAVDIPGSMDFPQYGDGTCEHGRPLTYQRRNPS